MSTAQMLVTAAYEAAQVHWPTLEWTLERHFDDELSYWMAGAKIPSLGLSVWLYANDSDNELNGDVNIANGDELLLEPRGLRLGETPAELGKEYVVALREALADLLDSCRSLCVAPPQPSAASRPPASDRGPVGPRPSGDLDCGRSA